LPGDTPCAHFCFLWRCKPTPPSLHLLACTRPTINWAKANRGITTTSTTTTIIITTSGGSTHMASTTTTLCSVLQMTPLSNVLDSRMEETASCTLAVSSITAGVLPAPLGGG